MPGQIKNNSVTEPFVADDQAAATISPPATYESGAADCQIPAQFAELSGLRSHAVTQYEIRDHWAANGHDVPIAQSPVTERNRNDGDLRRNAGRRPADTTCLQIPP